MVQPSVYHKRSQPFKPSPIINPSISLNFSRVGLSPTQLFSFQATWLTEERWISGASEIRASIACTRGPPIFDQARALLNRFITVTISHDQTHPKRWIAIQRAPFDAFYNAYREDLIWSVHSRSEGHNLIVTVHRYACIWTVDGA